MEIISPEVIILTKFSVALTVFLYFAVLAVILESLNWFLSLFVHFQHWFVLIGLASIALTLGIKSRKLLHFTLNLIATVFFSINTTSYWKPIILDKKINTSSESDLKVFYANISSINNNKQILISYLAENTPDYVLLVEMNTDWAKKLKTLEPIYPYSKMIPLEGNFGLGILSKFPLEVTDVLMDRENMIPALILSVGGPFGKINMAVLHAFPPIGSYGSLMRDRYIETLSSHFKEIKSPFLVCGDFNTTPWSHIFEKFLENSKLDLPSSTPNTWPSSFLLPSIPIDHCLSKNLIINEYRIGPDIGSDHWPLLFTIKSEN